MESSNTFGNIATSWLRNHGHPPIGYSDNFDESDDGSDDTSFYSKLSVDNLLLEAFQSSGKEYKLASSIREQMLEEQEANLSKEVEFYRPDKTTEVKEISWCLDNDFLEVGMDLWSGPWYFKSKEEWERALCMDFQKQQSIKNRLISQMQDKAKKFSLKEADIEKIASLKMRGNSLFGSKQYKEAIDWYDLALELFPLPLGPIPAKQLGEQVCILSNKAESLLKLQKYMEAQMVATDALILDCYHVKSLLRRAKATYFDAEIDGHSMLNLMATSMAMQDLDVIIALGAVGVREAEKLKLEIEANLCDGKLRHVLLQPEEKDDVDPIETIAPTISFESRRRYGDKKGRKKRLKLLTNKVSEWPAKMVKLNVKQCDWFIALDYFLYPSVLYSSTSRDFQQEDFFKLDEGLTEVRMLALCEHDCLHLEK